MRPEIIMEKRHTSRPAKRIKDFLLLMLQRLWISFELFQKNGLTNHAAAGAYGFLLSAAPVLLIIAFFVSRLLANSPDLAAAMIRSLGFLSKTFNARDFITNFLSSANPGLAGIISVIPLFWTARLCAQSIQRGLGVIFPPSRSNPVRSTLVTFGLGFLIILLIFAMLLGTILVRYFFNTLESTFGQSGSRSFRFLLIRIFFLLCLALMVLVFYRIVPMDHPKWKFIIPGTLACIIFHQLFSGVFSLIVRPDRYNELYGALGNLFLLLINVYFFFTFFLFGAQLIMVQGLSDALLFIRYRKLKSMGTKPVLPWDRIFASLPAPLVKYSGSFKSGELIVKRGSLDEEVYYILSGKAGVYLDDECHNRIAFIDENHFFGEMEIVKSEGRSASIMAETDLSAMILPRPLFRSILKSDPDTNQNLILDLSERLRSTNKQIGTY